MEIKYQITESDFLEFQLYTASKSKRIQKKKRTGWITTTIMIVALGAFFFSQDNQFMVIYCGIFASIHALFYPIYFRWRYKKHYKNYIKENHKNRINETVTLNLNQEYLLVQDKTGESKFKLSEIEIINEIQNHFFAQLSTGVSLILPKHGLENVDLFKTELENHGLKIESELNWKWK